MSTLLEEGVVIEVLDNQMAKVRLPRSSTCQTCHHSRTICDPFGSDHMIVEASNELNAQKGQVVHVQFSSSGSAKAVTILYIIPLICLLIGAVIGNIVNPLGNNDASAAVLAIVFLILSFVAIYYYHKKLGKEKESQARIQEIMS